MVSGQGKKPRRRTAVLAVLLLAAMACYAAGMAWPAVILVFSGIVLELLFWLRLFRRD